MNKVSFGIVTITSIFLATIAKAENYKIDLAHSNIRFEIAHMGISTVEGKFTQFEGEFMFSEKEPAKSTGKATIELKSIDTSISQRDQHLRSPDFFNVDKFPIMTYQAKKIEAVAGSKDFKVIGDLTLHGVTKEIPLNVKFNGKIKGMDNVYHAGFSANTTINREDFGLNWNKLLEGVSLVGKEVKVSIQIEATEVAPKK